MKLREEELTIIQNLAKAGGTGNVMEFLNLSSTDFAKQRFSEITLLQL